MRHSSFTSLVIACMLVACGSSETTAPAATAPTAGAEVTAAADGPSPAEAAPTSVDPVAASPDVFKVILDGEQMRILEATWQPGQRDNPHGHPTLVGYAVTDVQGLAYDDDGAFVSIRARKGRVFHQGPVTSHAFKNIGKGVAKMIIVELKEGVPVARMPKDPAPDAQTASPDVFELISFDARVRVLVATWQAGQSDEVHSHPALAAYAITDVHGKLTDEDGKVSPVDTKAGAAFFLDPVKAHKFENLGTEPAQLLLVEVRK